MGTADPVTVEVVAALPGRQCLVAVTVPAGTSARDAVGLAGIGEQMPELDVADCKLAIWGVPVADDHELANGDRVEILRPLKIDPRDARRELAREGQVMGVTKSR